MARYGHQQVPWRWGGCLPLNHSQPFPPDDTHNAVHRLLHPGSVVGALALSSTLQAQATSRLDILVVDSAGTPVRDAMVEVAGIRWRTRTEGNGVGLLGGIPPGNRLVYASRLGFGAARVPVEFRP